MYKARLFHSQYYHIYIRGNNREPIFKEEQNYLYFLKLYKRYIHPIAHLYAYCLLPTHFHFLIRIKDKGEIDPMYFEEDTLWCQFRNFLGTYTKAINKMYKRTGHLFAGRYSRLSIDETNHFFELITYIHQNPQDHGIVSDYKFWPFSSFTAYNKRDRRSLLARKLFSDDELYNLIMDMHQEVLYYREIVQ